MRPLALPPPPPSPEQPALPQKWLRCDATVATQYPSCSPWGPSGPALDLYWTCASARLCLRLRLRLVLSRLVSSSLDASASDYPCPSSAARCIGSAPDRPPTNARTHARQETEAGSRAICLITSLRVDGGVVACNWGHTDGRSPRYSLMGGCMSRGMWHGAGEAMGASKAHGPSSMPCR